MRVDHLAVVAVLSIGSDKVQNQSLSHQQEWQSTKSVVTSIARVARYRITCYLTIQSGKVTSSMHLCECRPLCSGRSYFPSIRNGKVQNQLLPHHQEWQGIEAVVISPSKVARYKITCYLTIKGGKAQNHWLPHHQEWQGTESVVTSPSKVARYRISCYLTIKSGKVQKHLLPQHQEWRLRYRITCYLITIKTGKVTMQPPSLN